MSVGSAADAENSLADLLLDTGMLQFGRFRQGTEFAPFLVSLDYLPAYPQVLKAFISAASVIIADLTADRLVATPDAVPFGVALSLQTACSLVYSRGRGEEAAFDLVGAYNSGHQAILLTNAFQDYNSLLPLISNANRVGLNIGFVLALIDFGIDIAPATLEVRSVLHLPKLIPDLLNRHRLPLQQSLTIADWIEQRVVNHRPAAKQP